MITVKKDLLIDECLWLSWKWITYKVQLLQVVIGRTVFEINKGAEVIQCLIFQLFGWLVTNDYAESEKLMCYSFLALPEMDTHKVTRALKWHVYFMF